ncbi:L-fuculose phosphate aldolase [bioreactor metagenome]|uniref:L-fuculose phosphate aldolase n=1 Tax=bioreactor metagenome TaxID=1076179 RepID=A0A644T0V7_9ZZZZ|nr:class II aldolase/adducin family protein [Negativicutes bacterium]
MDTAVEVRAGILKIGCALLEKGLVAGTWGNISARLPAIDRIAVTPSGRNYRDLEDSDIVLTDLEGNVIAGQLKPSSELKMHLEIYKARSDVMAIIHTHSIFASSCAVANTSIPPIIEDLVQLIGGSVDVAKYALPGTNELAKNVVAALGDKGAALLCNHGVVCCGGNLCEAFLGCELVERAAQMYIYASQLGGARELSREDVKVMHDFYLEHYRHRQKG